MLVNLFISISNVDAHSVYLICWNDGEGEFQERCCFTTSKKGNKKMFPWRVKKNADEENLMDVLVVTKDSVADHRKQGSFTSALMAFSLLFAER